MSCLGGAAWGGTAFMQAELGGLHQGRGSPTENWGQWHTDTPSLYILSHCTGLRCFERSQA